QSAIVVDPITNLINGGTGADVYSMLLRLVDHAKTENITALFTSLTNENPADNAEGSVSSLMVTWILVRNLETDGEHKRWIHILKSRGMAHSHQVRELALTINRVKLKERPKETEMARDGRTN